MNKEERYYAVMAGGQYRFDCLGTSYGQVVESAGEQACHYLTNDSEEDSIDIFSATDEELIEMINWKVVEVSKKVYDYLSNISWSNQCSNYVDVPFA